MPAALHAGALVEHVPHLETRKKQFTALKGEVPSPLNPPPGCHFHPRCPLAFDRCRKERPALKEIGTGRMSACHLNDAAPAQATVGAAGAA